MYKKNFCLWVFLLFALYRGAAAPPILDEDSPLIEDAEEIDCESTPGSSSFLSDLSGFTAYGSVPNLLRPAVKLMFQRYLYGLLHADINLILSVTSDKIDLPYYNKGMTKEMQKEFFSELFATYEINKVSAEELYCLNTGRIILFEGDRAMITVYARKDPPEPLKNWHYWEDFWGLQHHYFFEKINGRWRLIAFDIAYDPPEL